MLRMNIWGMNMEMLMLGMLESLIGANIWMLKMNVREC